jgi:hypothetical protein
MGKLMDEQMDNLQGVVNDNVSADDAGDDSNTENSDPDAKADE